jgi:hypothetical protein
MRSCSQCSNAPSPARPLDLSAYTEATRAELYARVVGIVFAPASTAGEALAAAAAADQADLEILYLFDRYFAVWALPAREAAKLPNGRLFAMVRIQLDPAAPAGLALYDV